LGAIQLDLGDVREAKESLDLSVTIRQEALATSPSDPTIVHGLALTYSTLGRYWSQAGSFAKAEKAYLKAARYLQLFVDKYLNYPHRRHELSVIHNDLAWIYLTGPDSLRDERKAFTHACKAAQLAPNDQMYKTLRGVVHYRKGELAQASKLFDSVAKSGAETPQRMRGWASDAVTLRRTAEVNGQKAVIMNWYFLAMTYQRRGEGRIALGCYERGQGEWRDAAKLLSGRWVGDLETIRTETEELLAIEEKPRHSS
jgi:tetratricopeptide (TPR) repeat protein